MVPLTGSWQSDPSNPSAKAFSGPKTYSCLNNLECKDWTCSKGTPSLFSIAMASRWAIPMFASPAPCNQGLFIWGRKGCERHVTWKRKVWSWRRVFVAFTAARTPATATLAVPWSLQTLFSRSWTSCLLVSVKPGCRRWRCSTWRRGKVGSLPNSNHQHSLVTIFLKESECIVVAKIFKLDQSVLTPSLYNGLESTVEMSSVLELTRPENWNNLAVKILFWQILTSSPPWTHRWTRHKRLRWLACDGDRCSRCRRAALVWEKRSFKMDSTTFVLKS